MRAVAINESISFCHKGSGYKHSSSSHLAASYHKLEMVERALYLMITVCSSF